MWSGLKVVLGLKVFLPLCIKVKNLLSAAPPPPLYLPELNLDPELRRRAGSLLALSPHRCKESSFNLLSITASEEGAGAGPSCALRV